MSHKIFSNLPFRYVIAVPFTLLIFLAVGLTGYLSYRNAEVAVNRLASDLHEEAIARVGQHLDSYLSTPVLINQLNLDAIRLGNLDISDQHAVERSFLAQIQRFETVVSVAYANEKKEYIGPGRKVLGADMVVGISSEQTGYVLEAYEITPEGERELITTLTDYDPRTRPWYQTAVLARRQVWTPIYMWSSGDVGIDTVVPVYSRDNNLLGVLSTSLTLNSIGAYLQSLKVSEHGETFIIERSGLLVASSTGHEPFMRVGDEFNRLSVFDVEEPVMKAAAKALEQEAGALENITGALSYRFEFSNEAYFAWMAPYADKFGLDWLIINIIPESDFMAQIYAGNRQTAILIGLSLLVSIIFAALITVWITRPLLQLNDSARAFARGEWGRRVSANRIDEIGELSQSFNHMAEQIQASFGSIRVSEKRYQSLFEDSPVSLWEEDGSQLKQHLDELRGTGITNWETYFEGHPEELRACVGLIKVNEVNRATMAIFGADTKAAFSNGLAPFLTEKSVKALRDELIALAEGNHYYETDAICQTLKGPEIIVHFRLSIVPGYEDTWSKLLLSLEDITQRKQAEENLRLSEARYRAVVENQTEFIVRWKADGMRTFANEAYLHYFGLTPEQAASSSFIPLVAKEDRSAVEGKISRLLSGGVDSETEIHRVINPDGSIGWQEWVDQAIKDETGRIIEFQSVGRDITERKRAEEALREKTEELERFFTSTLDLLCIADTNGYFRRLNREWEKVLGYWLEDLEGKRFLDLVHPDDQQATLAAMAQLNAQKEILDFTNRYRCKDGSYRWIEWRSIPHGKVIYSAARDITERKRIETALQESEKRYRDLVEFSPVAMTVHVEGRIVYINPAGVKLWGANKLAEVLGRSPLDFVHPDYHGRVTERIQQIQAMEQTLLPIEVKNIRLDGQMLYTVGTGIPITYQGNPAILSVVLDITERVQAEERMRELTRHLVAAQEEERKRIAQELHDELGQALTAISLDLGSIEKALPLDTSSEVRERLSEARSMADEVDERISELALDLRPSLLDDLGLLPTLQWYLNRFSQRLGIEVEMDFRGLEDRLPDEIETTIYRVVQEAMTNIARHAQASKAYLSLERSATAVTARIQDDGHGFDFEEMQSHAASPASLGLLGIKDRVSTLGGHVDILSGLGQGVCIRIEIPL